jgi:hypothetical protein
MRPIDSVTPIKGTEAGSDRKIPPFSAGLEFAEGSGRGYGMDMPGWLGRQRIGRTRLEKDDQSFTLRPAMTRFSFGVEADLLKQRLRQL